jgi:hypothetical protein
VVDEVLRHRRGGGAYPIYLTGVASAGLPEPAGSPPMALLALKRRIEGRLNAVLAQRGAFESAPPPSPFPLQG